MEGLNSWQAALVLTATEIAGDVAAKNGNNPLLQYGAYNAIAWELGETLHRNGNGIGLQNAYWNAATNISHALIGMYVYGEELSTQQLFGIGLVSAGIYFMAQGKQ